MLYKVTPSLTTPVETKELKNKAEADAPVPRKRRKSAVYDSEGHEVLITMMCLKCKAMKPLAMFGLRKMGDGAIRNQPWCRNCRSGAGQKKGAQISTPIEASPAIVTEPATEVEPSSSAAELLHEVQDGLS